MLIIYIQLHSFCGVTMDTIANLDSCTVRLSNLKRHCVIVQVVRAMVHF